MTAITAFCMEWHLTKSEACLDMLVRPLARVGLHVELVSWDGKNLPDLDYANVPYIFCQLPPPEYLLKQKNTQLIWLPMFDQAVNYPQSWWDSLPKDNLKIVSFSDAISARARLAGIKIISLKFFYNPESLLKASWSSGINVYYWNRRGLYSKKFIEKFCNVVNASKLYFMSEMDPGSDINLYYTLPNKIYETEVINMDFTNRSEHLNRMSHINVMIAPRVFEGIGMTFIESLTRGCAVFSCNQPTMNEYIIHKNNGYLFSNRKTGVIDRLLGKQSNPYKAIRESDQDWDDIKKIDLKEIGFEARLKCKEGYQLWLDSIMNYAKFVMDW